MVNPDCLLSMHDLVDYAIKLRTSGGYAEGCLCISAEQDQALIEEVKHFGTITGPLPSTLDGFLLANLLTIRVEHPQVVTAVTDAPGLQFLNIYLAIGRSPNGNHLLIHSSSTITNRWYPAALFRHLEKKP